MDSKYLIGGAALAAAYLLMGKKEAPCVKFKTLTNEIICEKDLAKKGYYYWVGGTNGSGYYNISDFRNVYSVGEALFQLSIKNGFLATQNMSDPLYVQAQIILKLYLKPGTQPLIAV